MSKIKLLLIAFTFNVLIFHAYSQNLKVSDNPVTFRPLKSSNGLIFGSLTFPKEKPQFNGYFLKIKCISTDKKVARRNYKQIRFTPQQIFKMKHDGELEQGLTYLFTAELAEGDYEITGIGLFTNSAFVALQNTSNTERFTISFKVQKGVIKYVGNIFFNEYAEKFDNTVITYKNNFQRDFDAIKIVQPYVYWKDAINETLNISY